MDAEHTGKDQIRQTSLNKHRLERKRTSRQRDGAKVLAEQGLDLRPYEKNPEEERLGRVCAATLLLSCVT